MSEAAVFSAEFQRAFVAMRYFLGARDVGLVAPLGHAPAGEVLEQRLAHADRERRAEALALEVGHVVRALEARTFR